MAGETPDDPSAVPASTVPLPPAVALEIFGTTLPLVEKYASLLAHEGVTWGLLGPREVGRLWDRHLLNCALLTDLIPSESSVVDLGSGAGLPGIVIALMRADLDVALVEPLARRTRFLALCLERLGLSDRVRIVGQRAEDLRDRVSADVVVSRAVAPLGRLAGWSVPLTRPGGVVLAIKGRGADDEVRTARHELRRLDVRSVEVVRLGTGVLEVPTTVVRLVRGTAVRRHRGG